MKTWFVCLALLLASGSFAQQPDSVKARPSASGLDKYKEKGRYQPSLTNGIPATPTNQSPQPPSLGIQKPESKRVESSYQYENGRVTGGKTTLKLGKKN